VGQRGEGTGKDRDGRLEENLSESRREGSATPLRSLHIERKMIDWREAKVRKSNDTVEGGARRHRMDVAHGRAQQLQLTLDVVKACLIHLPRRQRAMAERTDLVRAPHPSSPRPRSQAKHTWRSEPGGSDCLCRHDNMLRTVRAGDQAD